MRGSASAGVAAPVEASFRLLADLEGYRTWYPDVVRHVRVVERGGDGLPARAETTLHVSFGPLTRDFHLLLAVTAQPSTLVQLTRIPHDASDPEQFQVTWQIHEAGGTRLALDLAASLSVPRLVPVGGIGESMAQGFVAAAARALT